jgi:hypothetical protein
MLVTVTRRLRPPPPELLRQSSPLLVELLRSAWQRSSLPGYSIEFVSGLPPQKQRLYRQLRQTRFVEQLAAGPGVLPDIHDALPPPLQDYYRRFRPRDYRQLSALIIRFLEWYAEPSTTVPVERLVNWPLTATVALYAVPVGLAVALGSAPFGSSWLALLSLVPLIASAVWCTGAAMGSLLNTAQNAATLYLYLLEVLEETEVPTAETSAPVLTGPVSPSPRHPD